MIGKLIDGTIVETCKKGNKPRKDGTEYYLVLVNQSGSRSKFQLILDQPIRPGTSLAGITAEATFSKEYGENVRLDNEELSHLLASIPKK